MNTLKIKDYLITGFSEKETRMLGKEIFDQEVYSLKAVQNPKLIIDAGAYTGMATCWFHHKYSGVEVVAIEPNWIAYDFLQENLAVNGLSNVKSFNVALGRKPGTRELYFEDGPDGWNSIASFNNGGWRQDREQSSMMVKVIPLSKILSEVKQEVDLVKMDIEGAEQVVLSEAEQYLDRVKNFAIEFHPVGKQSITKISKILANAGFSVDVVEQKDRLSTKGNQHLAMIYATK